MQGNEQVQYNYNRVMICEGFINEKGELCGCEIPNLTIIDCLGRFEFSHEFAGKAVTVWIVSHDSRIKRPIALHLATAIAMGKVRRHRIDTSSLVGFFTRQQKAKR